MNILQNEAIAPAWAYSTVQQFCKRYPAFTVGGMRYQIFNEGTNGLKEAGAIIRNGRKVLIKESAYFAWLEGNQSYKSNNGGVK
jgi:hypothetical protein